MNIGQTSVKAYLRHGLTASVGAKSEMFLRISLLKTAVKLWLPLGRTPAISVSLRLRKEQC